MERGYDSPSSSKSSDDMHLNDSPFAFDPRKSPPKERPAVVVPCLVLLATCCQAGYVAPHVYHAAAVHVPVATTVVRQPVVEHHSEVAYVPPHAHGYTISQKKVVHPKTTVTKHDPFFGTYHQAEVHHAPVVTGSHSSVHQSRGGHFVHRPVGTVVY
ncbi:hypothetical protein HPB47_013567 [Ixodes persulcatus]|uniref:Uncharacterized protein n=1 Tax=Ixodes persulcatus TaxID=34615 RepID=A0AC60QYH5_IXOPE|nr:hypothetical protein HPB47_013567 [Ixodes persulcatus]